MRPGLFCARVFTLVFGIDYAIAVYGNWPLFRYYPLIRQLSLHDLADRTLGPAMAWYGWIAAAAVPAALASVIVPRHIGDRIPAAVFWILPLAAFAVGWYREKVWFH